MPNQSPPPKNSNSASGGNSTPRSLLVRLRENEAEAWDRLVTLYTPLVYFWCRKLGVSEQDTPDIVQEVFKSVAARIERFRKEKPQDTFRGWLRVITRSRAVDHYRRQSNQPAAVGGSVALQKMAEFPESCDDEPEDEPIYHGLFLRACDLIRTDFKESTWKAFWRVVVDGETPKDVAEELSMQPGAVRVAKSRVLQRLRQELGEFLE